MKNIFRNIIASVIMVLPLAACTEDADRPDAAGLPQASEINTEITVDNTTNEVTFELKNEECYPIWIFTEPDGKTTTSTVNGLKKLYASKGTFSVEVKMGNKNGISAESVTRSFTVENQLVDEEMMKNLCGATTQQTGSKTWVWNSTAQGHLGCGPSGSATGCDWYSAAPGEKAGAGIYDNTFTFASDFTYTFDPGQSGNVLVNVGCTSFPGYSGTEDYTVPVQVQNTSWEFAYEGENVYIVLPAGTLMGYVPGNTIYDNPKFRIAECSEGKLVLISDDGTISWRYEFVPQN